MCIIVNIQCLGEYFSEGFREYKINPNNLSKKDRSFFDFIKGLVK